MDQEFEYRVIPAPSKGRKGKGLRSREAKFANALSEVMNELGAEGWDYVRADTLPCEERTGLTSKTTHYLNMLVFRRARVQIQAQAPAPAPMPAPVPTVVYTAPAPNPAPQWQGFAEDDEDDLPAEMTGVVDLLAARRDREAAQPAPARTAAE